jgi:transcriptional antiterminator RfaH
MPFWAAARLLPQRERLATHCLELAGYEIYLPRLRETRVIRHRKVEVRKPLFPNYLFIVIQVGWYQARYCPGIASLIMNNAGPAHVPDAVIAEIRARERNGLVELPKPPPRFRPGDPVRILAGPFQSHLALFDNMTSHERVIVLLRLLGGQQRLTLPEAGIEAVRAGVEAVRP